MDECCLRGDAVLLLQVNVCSRPISCLRLAVTSLVRSKDLQKTKVQPQLPLGKKAPTVAASVCSK